LDTTLFDSANLATLANLFVVIAPIAGAIFWLVNRKLERERQPVIQTTRFYKEMPSEDPDGEGKDWYFGWKLVNSGVAQHLA